MGKIFSLASYAIVTPLLFVGLTMHQIYCWPWLRPGHRWGAHNVPQYS